METKLEIEKIEEKYLIPKDCVILDRHDYDMLMNKFYNSRIEIEDYNDRVNNAVEYIDENIIELEYVRKHLGEKNTGLDHITIECSATEIVELLNILKGVK